MDALPSIENLRCFDAAVRAKTFRAAARMVALSPAALGQRIRQLEEQLGETLFQRTSRSVRLTRAGEALVPAARRCLEDAAACADAVRSDGALAPVELTIGTRLELGMSWLVPAISVLEKRLPHVGINLYFGSGPDLMSRVRAGVLDCAITSSRLPDATLAGQVLHEERYVFVGTPKLLAERPLTRRPQASEHTLLDIDPELPLFRYFRDAPSNRGNLEFGNYRWLGLGAAIKTRVLADAGVAVLPEYMVQRELDRGRLRRLFPNVAPLVDHFRLVHRSDDARERSFSSIAEVLGSLPIR